ncbi:Ubiquitin fusion degradation protein 2, partial [Spraguea lophii 42_110]
VGPRCHSLSLKNMQEYQFEPKSLLRSIMYIYLDMKCNKFIEATVQEQLYFNINLFKRAFKICTEKHILNENKLDDLKEFIANLEQTLTEITSTPQETVPDNFLDPLTCVPMKDPIKLLTSNVTIDRSTFEVIMLGDGVDPFNRSPLDETKIEDDKELKEEIENFYKSKKI